MKRYTIFLLGLLLGLVLVGCEGSTSHSYFFHNRTNDTLYLHLNDVNYHRFDSITVMPPFQVVEFANYDDLGGNENAHGLSYFDSGFVVRTNGDTTNAEVFNPSKWEIISNHRTKAPSAWDHFYHRAFYPEEL